jgi:hypothetical protein
VGFGVWARAVEACRLHGHQDADLHVVVAEGLAREAYLAEEVPALEHLELSLGHLLGLAFQVLYPASRAPGVGAAAVVSVSKCKKPPRAPVTAKPSVVGDLKEDGRDFGLKGVLGGFARP